MDIYRGCDSRANPHPKCDTCGDVITRRSTHWHIYNARRRQETAQCDDCAQLTLLAAQPVIRAAECLGLDGNPEALRAALERNQIIVLAQGVLEICLN